MKVILHLTASAALLLLIRPGFGAPLDPFTDAGAPQPASALESSAALAGPWQIFRASLAGLPPVERIARTDSWVQQHAAEIASVREALAKSHPGERPISQIDQEITSSTAAGKLTPPWARIAWIDQHAATTPGIPAESIKTVPLPEPPAPLPAASAGEQQARQLQAENTAILENAGHLAPEARIAAIEAARATLSANQQAITQLKSQPTIHP